MKGSSLKNSSKYSHSLILMEVEASRFKYGHAYIGMEGSNEEIRS